jgi:hypothetical protein
MGFHAITSTYFEVVTDGRCDRGVVSAAFRLSVNVKYAEDPDTTYAVGPVAFWAFAEMSCGIVVVCAPLMPKFFVETGISTMFLTTARKVTGMGSSNNKMTTDGSMSTTGIKSAPRNYHKMYESDVPLELMGRSMKSESTECLQDDVDENGKSILRTTRVTVIRNKNTGEERFDRVVPWHARWELQTLFSRKKYKLLRLTLYSQAYIDWGSYLRAFCLLDTTYVCNMDCGNDYLARIITQKVRQTTVSPPF